MLWYSRSFIHADSIAANPVAVVRECVGRKRRCYAIFKSAASPGVHRPVQRKAANVQDKNQPGHLAVAHGRIVPTVGVSYLGAADCYGVGRAWRRNNGCLEAP